ncbi:MAG TPA: hypothetical protein VGU20_27225 [Stellaceae bacterium]|nr:hypothetical protein [Stellaceae bacterium]
MRRRTRRFISVAAPILSIFSTAIFAGLQFVGLAPKELLIHVLGVQQVEYIESLVGNLNSESARWSVVILGDLSFGLACCFTMLIPVMRLYRRQERLGQMIEDNDKKIEAERREHAELHEYAEAAIKKARESDDFARKMERSARRLHNQTREMLIKWRREKLLK